MNATGGRGGDGSGTAGAAVATSGGTQSTAGTALVIGGVNAQTNNYTAVAKDNGKLISFSSASALTLTLPAASPGAQWAIFVECVGSGGLTISRNGLNIDGAASNVVLGQNQGIYLTSDGTNYFTERGLGLTNPMTTLGDTIVGGTGGVPARLGVGANGKVLTANSSATDGLDYEAPIALTTTGTSGAATLTPGNPYTLNVPQYSGGGGGGLTLINSSVLGSAQPSVTFSSIPATFNHLHLMICARSSAAVIQDIIVSQFNGDTGTNYDYQDFYAQGTGSGSSQIGGVQGTATASPQIGYISAANSLANMPGVVKIEIANYLGTTFYKVAQGESAQVSGASAGNAQTVTTAIYWHNTAAINAILMKLQSGGNFITGSTFYLYGY